jgi:hypothetical protein
MSRSGNTALPKKAKHMKTKTISRGYVSPKTPPEIAAHNRAGYRLWRATHNFVRAHNAMLNAETTPKFPAAQKRWHKAITALVNAEQARLLAIAEVEEVRLSKRKAA